MGDFSADWLALREPADFIARSSQLAGVIADALAPDDIVQALDMASGTGSNVRYLAERLPPHQDWLLVDHDQALISQAPVRMSEWAAARGYEARVEPDGVMLQGDRLKCRVHVRRVDVADLTNAAIFDGRTAGHGVGAAGSRSRSHGCGAWRCAVANTPRRCCSR